MFPVFLDTRVLLKPYLCDTLLSTSWPLPCAAAAEALVTENVRYAGYRDRVEEFQARVNAQESTPETMRDLAQRNAELTRKLAEARAELAAERAAGAGLRRLVAELSLELQQAREELDAAWTVTRLPARPRTGCL